MTTPVVFYTEPIQIHAGRSTILIGLGDNESGERAAIYVTDGTVGADIQLTHEDAVELHEVLTGIVEAMGETI